MKSKRMLPFMRWLPLRREVFLADTVAGLTVALVTASVLTPLAAVGSAEYVTLAVQLAFMVGIIWALVAIFRLGFIINYLSRPVIEGFINAGGILIVLSQVRKLLGISLTPAGSVFSDLTVLLSRLNEANGMSIVIGGLTLTLLFLGRRFCPKLPVALIVASLATAVVYFLGLADPQRVAVPLAIVGEIPSGLPKPVWPVPSLETFPRLLVGALTFAFVGFMETCSVARGIAARSHQKLDVNQEAMGQAVASLGSAFCGGQPINGSFSRSALNFASGARTGMASVFTSLFVMVFLLFGTSLFHYLPRTVLAAIIIAAVIRLMNFRQLASFMKVDKADGVVAWVAFLGTLVFAPELEKGILLGATTAILIHLYRMMRPHVAILGRHTDGSLRDADLHHLEIERMLLAIRLDGRLFFANAAYFEDQVHAALDRFPEFKHVAVIFSGVNEIDSSGTEMLKELYGQLQHLGATMMFVGVKTQVKAVMDASDLTSLVGQENFFGTYDRAREAVIARMPSDMTYTI